MALQWFLAVYGDQFSPARQGPGTPADAEKVTLHEFPIINPRTESRDKLGTMF